MQQYVLVTFLKCLALGLILFGCKGKSSTHVEWPVQLVWTTEPTEYLIRTTTVSSTNGDARGSKTAIFEMLIRFSPKATVTHRTLAIRELERDEDGFEQSYDSEMSSVATLDVVLTLDELNTMSRDYLDRDTPFSRLPDKPVAPGDEYVIGVSTFKVIGLSDKFAEPCVESKLVNMPQAVRAQSLQVSVCHSLKGYLVHFSSSSELRLAHERVTTSMVIQRVSDPAEVPWTIPAGKTENPSLLSADLGEEGRSP